ncbi:MAG: class I SAM-dependent methyltransferase [Syntrophaceae bacterium]
MTDKRSVAERCSAAAKEYDSSKGAQGWRGPEAVFGLMYASVGSGDSLLDIGIGTGLGSVLFHKAGLLVHGMDLSREMLDVCREKNIAEELKVHDLTLDPYPYTTASLHHAVCIGVLNHFESLDLVFREVSRILKDNGIFGLVVVDRNPEEASSFDVEHAGSRHTMFRHCKAEISDLLGNHGFEFLRELEFTVPAHKAGSQPMRMKAYAVRRMKRIEPEN